jgi:hypothetical protein
MNHFCIDNPLPSDFRAESRANGFSELGGLNSSLVIIRGLQGSEVLDLEQSDTDG